jgi:hypothetical protein
VTPRSAPPRPAPPRPAPPHASAPKAKAAAPSVARTPRPRVALHDAPAPEPVSQPAAIGAISAQRLARALGTRPTTEPDGTQSVTFPTPGGPAPAQQGAPSDYVPFSTAPVTVSRDFLGDVGHAAADAASHAAGSAISHAETAAEGVVDHGAAAASSALDAAAPGPSAPPPAPGAGMDVEDIADAVIDKLRREMLIERELGGGAMDLI